jgi:hypothetical protein
MYDTENHACMEYYPQAIGGKYLYLCPVQVFGYLINKFSVVLPSMQPQLALYAQMEYTVYPCH